MKFFYHLREQGMKMVPLSQTHSPLSKMLGVVMIGRLIFWL
jgi:hypothetical protein